MIPKVAFTGRRPPLHLDPPEHTPYRAALNPLLSERRVAHLEPAIRRFTVDLLEPLVAQGHADICADFSSHLPIRVFAEWMNLRDAEAEGLARVGRAYNMAVQSAIDDVVKVSSLELYEIARSLIARRKVEPLDPATNPTTALLQARYQGEPLPDDLIIGTVRQVLVVGIIAPTVMIGSIAVHLARHPDLQRRLRAEPDVIPAADRGISAPLHALSRLRADSDAGGGDRRRAPSARPSRSPSSTPRPTATKACSQRRQFTRPAQHQGPPGVRPGSRITVSAGRWRGCSCRSPSASLPRSPGFCWTARSAQPGSPRSAALSGRVRFQSI